MLDPYMWEKNFKRKRIKKKKRDEEIRRKKRKSYLSVYHENKGRCEPGEKYCLYSGDGKPSFPEGELGEMFGPSIHLRRQI
jgi:hypothetical protein